MNKPTKGQWRGYLVLCCLLAALLLCLLLLPPRVGVGDTTADSTLAEAVARYGDEIRTADADADSLRRHAWYRRDGGYEAPRRYHDSLRRDVKPRERIVVEINAADSATLRQLYGIGPVLASRIVRYRALLGGFASTEQLREVYGVSDECFAQLAPYVVVDTALLRKIDINNASVADLKRHPYIDYYQAKAIVDFRNKGGHFNSSDDLLKIVLLDEETVSKLRHYIQFN